MLRPFLHDETRHNAERIFKNSLAVNWNFIELKPELLSQYLERRLWKHFIHCSFLSPLFKDSAPVLGACSTTARAFSQNLEELLRSSPQVSPPRTNFFQVLHGTVSSPRPNSHITSAQPLHVTVLTFNALPSASGLPTPYSAILPLEIPKHSPITSIISNPNKKTATVPKVSTKAKSRPGQRCFPQPNRMKAFFCFLFTVSHRSGLNSSASFPQIAFDLCTVLWVSLSDFLFWRDICLFELFSPCWDGCGWKNLPERLECRAGRLWVSFFCDKQLRGVDIVLGILCTWFPVFYFRSISWWKWWFLTFQESFGVQKLVLGWRIYRVSPRTWWELHLWCLRRGR